MQRARAAWILLATSVGASVVSCGRIGYDPLAPPDEGGRQDGVDGSHPVDATLADAVAAIDAGADGSVPDAGADADAGQADADPAGDAKTEADASPYPACSSIASSWVFTFTSDPTAYDGNGDGIPDWTVRGGGAFPVAELDAGVWWSASQTPLDTRPLDSFSKRVIVDVRLLSTAVAAANRGAVFWINLNENGPQFSALFASAVAQPDGGQALSLFGKPDASAEAPIATFPDLPSTFIDLHLDIDPSSLVVGVWIDQGFQGTYTIPPTGVPNTDSFATLLSWTGLSGFAFVSVVECAN